MSINKTKLVAIYNESVASETGMALVSTSDEEAKALYESGHLIVHFDKEVKGTWTEPSGFPCELTDLGKSEIGIEEETVEETVDLSQVDVSDDIEEVVIPGLEESLEEIVEDVIQEEVVEKIVEETIDEVVVKQPEVKIEKGIPIPKKTRNLPVMREKYPFSELTENGMSFFIEDVIKNMSSTCASATKRHRKLQPEGEPLFKFTSRKVVEDDGTVGTRVWRISDEPVED